MAGFYTSLMEQTTSPLQAYISSTSSSIIGAITPVATTLLMIYVMFWGWSMIRGVISEPITDGITRIVKLTVICAIALSVGMYSQFLVDWLWQSPDSMASIIAGGQQSEKINFLDKIFEKLWIYSNKWEQAAEDNAYAIGIPDLACLIIAWLIRLADIALTGYAAFLFVLAKMALAVILAVGPIFILVLMFESSKRFFDSWIGQALNFGFVIILTSAILKLTGAYLDSSINTAVHAMNASGKPPFVDAIMVLASCAVILLLLLQVSSIAAALSGGTAVSTMGAVGWAFNKIRGVSSQAYRFGSGRTLSDWRGRRRQAATNARWASNNPSFPARAAAAAARRVRGEKTNTVAKN
jgi:type IV secretion system protein VirB6